MSDCTEHTCPQHGAANRAAAALRENGHAAWNRQADLRILEWLQAAAEDTRQRDLTRSLGQVECRANHSMRSALGERLPCPCGARL